MPPDATAILDLWERVDGLAAIDRSVALVAAATPELDHAAATALPLGERDRRLLSLRSTWSDTGLASTVDCPRCGTTNEFTTDVDFLLRHEATSSPSPVAIDGRSITWRHLDSADLALAADAPTIEEAERAIIERCVMAVDGRLADVDNLTESERAAVGHALEEADPLIEAVIDLLCVECGTRFLAELDIANTVLVELAVQARTILSEVDILARRYGWTEPECLALSPARRSWYLELTEGSR